MNKQSAVKTVIVMVVACMLLGVSALPVFSQTGAKQPLMGFSAMAAAIEKNYGPVLELDLELKNGEPVYQTKVVINNQRVSIYLNAISGAEISRRPPERLDYEDSAVYGYITGGAVASDTVSSSTRKAPAQGTAQQPKISYERAKEIALAKTGGGTVREIDLDYERGVLVYEVEVRSNNGKYDVNVDAQTGEVLKFKQDW